MVAEIELKTKGAGIPKTLLKYAIPLTIVAGAGYLLIKNLPSITSFLGSGLGSVFNSVNTSLSDALSKFNASVNNAVNGGNVQGNPQSGDTVYHLTDSSGKTQVVPAGSVAQQPELNLVDPNTLQQINLGDFQNKYPSLYSAISSLKIPTDYETQYLKGTTNQQPASFGDISGLSNVDVFDLNVALGANPDTGEFDVPNVQYYVAGDKVPRSLTPYEINYDLTHGIKLVKA